MPLHCQNAILEEYLKRLLASLPAADSAEPAVNIITTFKESEGWTTIVIPRGKHRPDCYFAIGEGQRIISPGTLDMAGVIIAARREDFEAIDADEAASIIKEVSLPAEICRQAAAKLSQG